MASIKSNVIMSLVLAACTACGKDDDDAKDEGIPAKYTAFAGTYEVTSAKESTGDCAAVTSDVLASTKLKYFLLYPQTVFGTTALFLESCETPEGCAVEELPLFVPNVSAGELPKLTGEGIRASSYSGTSCNVSNTLNSLEQIDADNAVFVTTTYGGKVEVATQDECKPDLAISKKDSLACTRVTETHLKRR